MAEKCCPGCRTTVREGDRFCAECGTPVGSVSTAVPDSAASPPDSSIAVSADDSTAQQNVSSVAGDREQSPRWQSPAAAYGTGIESAGACPVKLEVRMAREVPLGSQGLMEVRLSRRSPAGACLAELEIAGTVEPHRNMARELDLKSSPVLEFSEQFLAAAAGMHQFNFIVHLPGESGQQVWEGRLGVTVPAPTAGNVFNVVDQRRIEARVVVGTEGTQLNLGELAQTGVRQAGEFEEVVLARRQRVDTLHFKTMLPGCELPSRSFRSLTLRFRTSGGIRNVCLVAGEQVHLGKRRRDPRNPSGNDIVIRALPPGPTNNPLTELISRQHAAVRFTTEGLVWQNLDCKNGTQIDDTLLDPTDARQLTQGAIVRPAGVVPLQCTLFYGDPVEADPSYARFEARLPVPPSAPSIGRVRAARFRRVEELPVREEYLVFQRAMGIGSDPACGLHIDHDSVASMHAQILLLGGILWLEPCQSRKPSLFADKQIPPDHLVPLRPNQLFVLGEIEIAVREFLQEFIDT